jgi:hypothetical protein
LRCKDAAVCPQLRRSFGRSCFAKPKCSEFGLQTPVYTGMKKATFERDERGFRKQAHLVLKTIVSDCNQLYAYLSIYSDIGLNALPYRGLSSVGHAVSRLDKVVYGFDCLCLPLLAQPAGYSLQISNSADSTRPNQPALMRMHLVLLTG